MPDARRPFVAFFRPVAALALLAASLAVTVVVPASPAGADVLRPFTPVFSQQTNGSIQITGNTVMTCGESSSCAQVQAATSTGSNNNFVMSYLDVDTDPSTTRSSSADLAIPGGARVIYAGLFWGAARGAGSGGDPASGAVDDIRFRAPGASAYSTLTAERLDNQTSGNRDYSAYRDVTSLVQDAGPGTYWGADIAAATGRDRYAGWSLVVALADPSAPLRDLTVFSGYATVKNREIVDTTISGFLAPPSGSVDAKFGVVTYEGDNGITGDYLQVNSTRLADALSPSANFFTSRISANGANLATRDPSWVNNLSQDAKVVDAPGVIDNGATSANVRFATSGDFYYPAALTTQIDLYAPTIQGSKSVTNLSGSDPARVGDVLEYSMAFSNTGEDAATNTVITDQLPANTTYVPGSIRVTAGAGQGAKTDADGDDQGEYVAADRTVQVRVGDGATAASGGRMASGDTTAVTFQVRVDAASAGTTLTNTASLDYRAETLDRDYSYDTAEVTTPVAEEADISITKTASPRPVTAGDQITYTLTVANAGPSTAAGVRAIDTLPAGVTYLSSTPSAGSCAVAGGTLTCALGSIASGDAATVSVVVRVPPGSAATFLTNVARATSTTSDPDTDNNFTSVTTPVVRQADLSLSKTAAPSSPVPGNDVTYTLVATNNGASRATAVTLTDTLPPSLTVRSATSTRGDCTVTGRQISCAAGALDPDESMTVTVVATVPPGAAATPLSNNARVSSSTPDPAPGNNAATATITPAAPRADLVVTKETLTSPVVAGQPVQYAVTVSNDGPSNAAAVTLVDDLPASLSDASVSSTAGSCSVSSGAVSCAFGTLAAGRSVRVVIDADLAATATGTLGNSATASSATTDPEPGNNTGTTSAPVTASADLALTKTAEPVIDGNSATYTIVVTNEGPSTARAVTVTDPVPTPLTYEGSTTTSGSCSASGSPTTVTCDVGDLAVGASATITVTAATPGDGSARGVSNTATVSSPTPDPVAANNSATYALPTQSQADLALTKSVSPQPVVAGRTVTWTLTARNTGPSLATGVTITDTVPARVTGVVASTSTPGADCAASVGSDVSCTAASLPSGSAFVVTVTGTVAPGAASGALANAASVAAQTPTDPSPGNNSASATTQVVARADVSVVKEGPSTAVAGSRAAWTMLVRNAGPSTATGVVLSDSLPADVTFVSAASTPDGTTCTARGGEITCPVGTLAPGEQVLVTVTGAIDSGVADGTVLSNTGGVTATTPDPVPGNNADDHTTAVTEASDLTLSKSAQPTTMVPGAESVYLLEVSNAGPSDARDVVLTDTLDGDLTVLEASLAGGSCEVIGQQVTCRRELLPAGASAQARIRVLVAADRTTTIVNTAQVTTPSETTPADNEDTLGSPVAPRADLVLVKTASEDEIAAGRGVTYTLTVVNDGPSLASGVVVSDTLPADVVPTSASTIGGTCVVTGQVVECDLGDVEPGRPLVVTVVASTAPGAAPGIRTNAAEVSSDTLDASPDDNTSRVDVAIVSEADVRLTKTADAPVAVPGQQVTWRIVASNSGPSTARDVVVTDTVPDGVTITSAFHGTATPCTVSGQAVTCDLGDQAPGQRVVTIRGTLASGFDGASLSNTARASSGTDDPTPGNNTATTTSSISRLADLEVVKTISPANPVAGQRVTYTLSVYNNGPSDALNPQLIDQLPSGLTDVVINRPTLGGVPATAECELRPPTDPGTADNPTAPTVFCDGPVFRANLPARVIGSIEATVAPGFTGSLTNTARISSDTIDVDADNNESSVTSPVTASAGVSLTKTASPVNPVPGQDVTWTIEVVNSGPSVARDVTVTDDVLDAITGLSASAPCTVAAGNEVSCALGDLDPGAVRTLTLRGGLPASYTGAVDNTATVASPTDTTPGDNTSTTTGTASPQADVSITKTATPVDPVPGRDVTWTIQVTNAGPSVARDVTVTDDVLDAITALTASAPCTVAAGNEVTCRLGDIDPASTRTITLTGRVPSDFVGDVDNTATVTSPTDTTPGNNTASTSGTGAPAADLAVTKTLAPATPVPGEPVTWTVTVTNTGPSTARGVSLTDDVDDAITRLEVTGDGSSCTIGAANTVGCDLGALGAGASRVLTLRGILASDFTGTLANTARAASPADTTPGNNSATVEGVAAPRADLSLTKTMSPQKPVAGRSVTFTMLVRNAGPSTARQVVLSDELIPALAEATASITGAGSCRVEERLVTCTVAALAPGASATVTVRARVDEAYTGEVTNVAAVSAATPDPDPSNNTAWVGESGAGSCGPTAATSGKVVVCPDLALAKTASPEVAGPGDTVTYTITVTNDGPSAATDVAVVDELDEDLTLVSAKVVGGRARVTVTDRSVTAVFATLRPSSEGVLRLVAQLDEDAAGSVPNVAIASTGSPDVGDVEVQAEADVEVLPDDDVLADDGAGGGDSGDDVLPDTGMSAGVAPLAALSVLLVGAGLMLLRRSRVSGGRSPGRRA